MGLALLVALPGLPRLAAWLANQEGKRKGYRVDQLKLRARDGTKLSTSVYVPEGEGPFPAIIMVHSWFFTRWQCHLYAPYFAQDGYIVVAYDCRGWGTSGDQVHCADPDCELADVEDVIDWLTEKSGLPVNKESLGITGLSYGGGHSFLAAARDPRIKAAVPMNGWTDLEASLNPNGSLKIGWAGFLAMTATWATKLNPRNDLYRWIQTLLFKRDRYREFEEDMRGRSAIYHEDAKCPMLIICAWNDELFDPNQNLAYFDRLNQPKMLYITNGIHISDGGIGPRFWGKDLWGLTKRWFDYWLKGEENGVLSEPLVRLYKPWKREMVAEQGWPPPGVRMHTLYPRRSDGEFRLSSRHHEQRGLATLKPSIFTPVTSGPSLIKFEAMGIGMPGPMQDAGSGYFSFTTSPSRRDYEMIGIAKLRLALLPLAEKVQVNALLYDVPPQGMPRLITHGTMTMEGLKPGSEIVAEMDLIARADLIPKGNRIRLTLSGSDFPYTLPVYGKGAQVVYGDGESRLLLPLRGVD
ncbi:MAG: hypothetical protein A2V52_02850 [Actinobacteria bacterium RBG_19FT_COMBO_54_7]|nr:MAG: hypothetical protein A2V52_02850 [Actinobacteria bacterium RBG_19FT_COMBO_54_7]